ncbi:tetranectin-like [Branchiostoma lanceolatum]|uniref:tetranectin-like n=1 Tax=Branchiostoma lanceolatum TaxID=7740 RepID=UPI0034564C6A
MSVWVYMILAIACVSSPGSSSNDGPCEASMQATKLYSFVGRPQFSNPLYRDQSALQATDDLQIKTKDKIGSFESEQTATGGPQFSSPLYRNQDAPQSTTVLQTEARDKTGYTMWREICYKAFNTRKTFSEAAAACGEDGGTVAMPRDNETNAFLISLHNAVNDEGNFWFGLHDQREEGSFETSIARRQADSTLTTAVQCNGCLAIGSETNQ